MMSKKNVTAFRKRFEERQASLIRKFRQAVAAEATKGSYDYCGGQAEKAEHHVDQIIPALCRVIGISERDLAALMDESE